MMEPQMDVWEVQKRVGHQRYKTILTNCTAGEALGVYGRLDVALNEGKRLVRNGKVVDLTVGPTEQVRPVPLNDTKLARATTWEYGVLTSVATSNDDILPARDEGDAIEIAQQIKHAPGDIKATPVRRQVGHHDDTWRNWSGYTWSYQIDTWKGVRR